MNKPTRVGQLEKTVRSLFMILFALAAPGFNATAQTMTNLYSFGSVTNDGRRSVAGLVQGSDGSFYGTTPNGGSTNYNLACDCYGNGTVFRISPGGGYTNLYFFGSVPNDGVSPVAGLVQGSDGNFYGTTSFGYPNNSGTLFMISPSGNYTNLYSFGLVFRDGENPTAGLVQGSDGNFYGTTSDGGANGDGIVFRISPGGNYTNLYSFGSNATDGIIPEAGLVQGSDGNFYGTTVAGGANYNGTVFRISPTGACSVLYPFGGDPDDGENPQAGLVQGSDGNFYSTTPNGGANNYGTVFRISPGGCYTNLYSFGSDANDGITPEAGLVQGSDGNFYGTTVSGGAHSAGIVYQISLSGSYSNLYSFGSVPNDGGNPHDGLLQGSDGNFYGTTSSAGMIGYGTVFKLNLPLSPPPSQINQITGLQVASADHVFSIQTIAGETYQLQYRSSLSATWSNVPGVSVTNSIGSTLTFTNVGGALQPQGFYRFVITP